MRYIHIICMGLIFLLIGANTKAEELELDGNELLQNCTEVVKEEPSDSYDSGFCHGFLHGYSGARVRAQANLNFPPYCVPKKILTGQVTRVVVKYLQDHPEQLHFSPAALVSSALHKAFPCKAQLAPE